MEEVTMKNTLERIMDELDPSETDALLADTSAPEISRLALARIKKRALESAGLKKLKTRRPYFRALTSAAICLVFSAGFAAVAEAKEYGDAVDFFEVNGLSAEGLSREEIRLVYRDITTRRFTDEKTAEVIRRSIPGTEILPKGSAPSELAALWDGALSDDASESGFDYRISAFEKPDPELGFDVFERSVVECYDGEDRRWTAEFTSFYVDECIALSEGSVAWGRNDAWSSEQPTYGYLALLDELGNKRWERRTDHGFRHEYIAAVLEDGDGTLAVVSRGDLEYLCLARLDRDGNEIAFQKTKVGNRGIWNAARLGDGYLVQLGNAVDGDNAHLVKLDRDGSVTDDLVYESDESDFFITDMAEFGGSVYLSAYAVPRRADGSDECGAIWDRVGDVLAIADEEITSIVRENYTAVLLLCDPESGSARTFYSVKSALGDRLRAEDGRLLWSVNEVVNAYFSPYTSAFSVGGSCKVLRYAFDEAGALIACEETGETTPFTR
ncbi:MAG: hypothetical protein NC084_07150 [Bacteroides sp.]|nr:hypothetical protein [Eubacterium sp.]MCM1418374.1 hypothetical protein [Roseburia sp.]MCM1462475.1 hypothetical protein [Bacteroides sp.]